MLLYNQTAVSLFREAAEEKDEKFDFFLILGIIRGPRTGVIFTCSVLRSLNHTEFCSYFHNQSDFSEPHR